MSEEQHQPKPMSPSCEQQNYKLLFCRLTPELSRAERGGWKPVLLACPEVSTKPRNGVGLNDLLGGKEAGEGEALTHLPKGRSRDTWARPAKFQSDVDEATASVADSLAV